MAPQNERLKKLKALAERGIGGEKENAAALLEKLCEKYQISQDEIESSDEIKLRWFRYTRGERFEKLLFQCMYKTLGKGHTKYTRRAAKGGRTSEIGVRCTIVQGIEIELDYSFYSDALESEIDRLFEMFIQKNEIFPSDVEESTGGKELTREDILLYRSIKKQTRVLQITGNIREKVS